MKVLGIWFATGLLATVMATAAFAKVDTLHKDYSAQTDMILRAKSMHQQKIILLQHPEKMAKLQKQYGEMSCDMACKHGLAVKERFYQKALQVSGSKRGAVPATPDAKTMHNTKCENGICHIK